MGDNLTQGLQYCAQFIYTLKFDIHIHTQNIPAENIYFYFAIYKRPFNI